jgi:molybdopterin/thiamine biosynthesis adenylyltransferase
MSILIVESPRPSASAGKVLLIGLGGLGCPAALALAQAGVGTLTLCDDDCVDEGNLHRQILFEGTDVGAHKLDAARRALGPIAERSGTRLQLVKERFLPDNARQLVAKHDLVLEGADNFATKFLAADACHLEQRPVVHGAAIRWVGTAWAVPALGQPCYRCLFEDLPSGLADSCDSAGVMGPVVGIVGAMMAELALRVMSGGIPYGHVWTLDGKADTLRQVPVHARADCPLCGTQASIHDIHEPRYLRDPRLACVGPSGDASNLEGAKHGRYSSNSNPAP